MEYILNSYDHKVSNNCRFNFKKPIRFNVCLPSFKCMLSANLNFKSPLHLSITFMALMSKLH